MMIMRSTDIQEPKTKKGGRKRNQPLLGDLLLKHANLRERFFFVI